MTTGKGGFGINLDQTGRPKKLNGQTTTAAPGVTGAGGYAIAIRKTNRDLSINPETYWQ